MRDVKLHVLKCWPAPLAAVEIGRKPFEVRRDDRDYQEGDLVILREFIPGHLLKEEQKERENWHLEAGAQNKTRGPFRIGYLLRGAPMPEGFCAFTLIPLVPEAPR